MDEPGHGNSVVRAGTTSRRVRDGVSAATSAADVATVPLAPEIAPTHDRAAAARQLDFEPLAAKRNHGLFRYPAKFHPPIARKLVELFSAPGQTVLDPFCGSGTLLVEAAMLGRNSVGTDVDPLAIFIADAKTRVRSIEGLDTAVALFASWLDEQRSKDEARWGTFEADINEDQFAATRADLADWIPDLPRMAHWFRRRAVIQLAEIRRYVSMVDDARARQLFELCFASIIRNSSNADPVPVSGLEVTSHMLAKEKKGRTVDPWRLMRRAVQKMLPAMAEFVSGRSPVSKCRVEQVDARVLDSNLIGQIDAVITSPPYLTAVDYYRRHTLEMYWLGLTQRREQRLELLPRYLGRDKVGLNGMPDGGGAAAGVATRWLTRFSGIRIENERSFRHYCDGMARALLNMANLVVGDGPVVIVAGDVRFRGVDVSMLELMRDLASPQLYIADHLWYPIINRYMSYTRHNEASVAADRVLVFRKK